IGVGHVETGIAVWKRRPDSRVGVLLIVAGLLWLVQGLRRSSVPGLFSIGIVSTNAYNPVLLQLVLSIPAGRLRGRGDRALVIAFYIYSCVVNVGGWLLINHRRLLGGVTPRNVFLIADQPQAWARLQVALTVALVLFGGLILGVLVTRYAHASELYRYAFAPMWIAGLAKTLGNLAWASAIWRPGIWPYAVFFAGSAVVPAAAAVSVSRSRPTSQAMTRVVLGLGEHLSSAHQLESVLRRTTADPSLRVLRYENETDRFLTLDGSHADPPPDHGEVSSTRLQRQGQQLGALIHDSALFESPEVLRAVEQLAALVLENDRLLGQLEQQLANVRESRRRIVEAGDAERARVERNMHDAVQQRLVAALLLLRRADRDLKQSRGVELLQQGADEIETALRDLRDIVRGMHPHVIVEGGLQAAIESISERATVAIRYTSSFGETDVPIATSVTAYYVIAEAVTNVEKHAHATVTDIQVSREDKQPANPTLLIVVADDGVGGATLTEGGGLAGLRDRAEAFGGALTVTSVPRRGTRLVVRLPLSGELDPGGHDDPSTAR
ncbi:MAG: histidine kinase, partial [Marmoricola sp.]|nr:histidine kinase [Marmoricola sp.]